MLLKTTISKNNAIKRGYSLPERKEGIQSNLSANSVIRRREPRRFMRRGKG